MAGRTEITRDLRLGLLALERGLIDSTQLVSAIRAWARSGDDRSLASILMSRKYTTLERLQEVQAGVDASTDSEPPQTDSANHEVIPQGAGTSNVEIDATVAYVPSGEFENLAWQGKNAHVGRFQVLEAHARGGLGEVFLALDTELRRRVALKELRKGRARDPDAQARFLVEAELTGRLEHPGVVPVYSLGRHPDGRPFYAMRMIEGETLGGAIARLHASRTALRERERERLFRRILRGIIDACNTVAYAHSRGIIHRDLKPDNVMLGPFGETLVVDWGVAKALHTEPGDPRDPQDPRASEQEDASYLDGSMTSPGALIGTPRYMSPEQAAGDLERVGPASDIYGLGAILYCLLVGHAPFLENDLPTLLDRVRRGIFPTPRRARRTVDPTLEAICLKAMALDPEARHTSALDLASDLEGWQADVRYRGEQEQALSQVRSSLTRLCLERAYQALGSENSNEGMLWLARALENAPTDPPDLERVVRMSLTGWHLGPRLMERAFRHPGPVRALACCPEGRRLATFCSGPTTENLVHLWDLSAGTLLCPPLIHSAQVVSLAFHPGEGLLLTADAQGGVQRWDAVSGKAEGAGWQYQDAPESPLLLRFSPEGSRLATFERGRLTLWEGRSARDSRLIDAFTFRSRITAFQFAPDGRLLALGFEDGTTRLLDGRSGEVLREGPSHAGTVIYLGFASDGSKILSVSRNGEAKTWGCVDARIFSDQELSGTVVAVDQREAGDTFATAFSGGGARLWDMRSGQPIGETLTHRLSVSCLAFQPGGTVLATGGQDGTVRLWCALTGLSIGPVLAHGSAVQSLVFSPDGRRLAVGGTDATVRCWSMPEAIEGTAERVGCWVSTLTELEFDRGDAIRRMDGVTSWECRRRLSELGGSPLR